MNNFGLCWLPSLLIAILGGCYPPSTNALETPTVVKSDSALIAVLGLPGTQAAITNFGLQGSVHLFDEETRTQYHSDSAGFYKKNVPASTFKIFSSLIALEKGLIKDQYEVKAWNNRSQKNDNWNKDQHLKEAFALSTNWFFEDITTALGIDTLNACLKRIGYPVMISQGQDKFWLDEHFAVSPEEQIALMQKLYHRTLPFSQRTYDITRDIMLRKDTLGIKIYGKTGWGTPNGNNVGWYVGWAESVNRKPIYFATCIEQAEPARQDFEQLRKSLTESALMEARPKTRNQTQRPQSN
jgi:beta-lactamase class D